MLYRYTCTCIVDWRPSPWERVMICSNELLAVNLPAMSKPCLTYVTNVFEMPIKHQILELINIIIQLIGPID